MFDITKPPVIVTSSADTFEVATQTYLENPNPRVLLIRNPNETNMYTGIDTVFSDADGTVVEEGATRFSDDMIKAIGNLAHVGVGLVIVTGKPFTEARGLAESLPPSLSAQFIIEKGAYVIERNRDGSISRRNLLTTDDLTHAVSELKGTFLEKKTAIESQFKDAVPGGVFLGRGGQGTHESIMSVDVLHGNAPDDYLSTSGKERDAIKVTNQDLLVSIEQQMLAFVETHAPGWRCVNLGNGNFEISPGIIEKDLAIQTLHAYRGSQGALLLGDSNNDEAMLSLRQIDEHPRRAGLVLHRLAALSLVPHVDTISFGMANAYPHLSHLYALRKHLKKT